MYLCIEQNRSNMNISEQLDAHADILNNRQQKSLLSCKYIASQKEVG